MLFLNVISKGNQTYQKSEKLIFTFKALNFLKSFKKSRDLKIDFTCLSSKLRNHCLVRTFPNQNAI